MLTSLVSRTSVALSVGARLALVCVPLASTTFADPLVDPPCDLKMDPVYCVQCTSFERDMADPELDKYRFEFAFLNWTTMPCYGIVLYATASGTVSDAPPRVSKAYIDSDGRPLSGPSAPIGPYSQPNDWPFGSGFSTAVTFNVGVSGTPIPNPTATVNGVTYNGLKDPLFSLPPIPPTSTCAQAVSMMIPGSNVSLYFEPGVGFKYQVVIPDPRTVNDGMNVRDGFVIEIDDFDDGEEISFNWFLTDVNGKHIGEINGLSHAVTGDDFGFGAFNLSVKDPALPGLATAPIPLYKTNTINPGKVNKGYFPKSNAQIDNGPGAPTFFAEETDPSGNDQYNFNPLPATAFGFGTTAFGEPGAVITADFANPANNPGVGVNAQEYQTMPRYGTGCAGAGGIVPALSMTGMPKVGASLDGRIAHGLGGSFAMLLWGTQKTAHTLPGGCVQLVGGVVRDVGPFVLGGVGPGNGDLRINIPVSAVLFGITHFAQAAIVDAASASGMSFTNGLEIRLVQ